MADATAQLKAAGLTVGRTEDDPTSDATKVGTVTGTNPPAGQQVKGGSAVDLKVGVKQSATAVPDVTGQKEDDATQALQAAGFQVQTQDVDGPAPKGRVLSTSPAAGQKAAPGSTVTINLSNGNQASTVPDVRGQSENQAKKALKDAGYTNIKTQSVDANGQVQDGRALGTDPGAGSQADPDQTVTLYIARGGGGGNVGGFNN